MQPSHTFARRGYASLASAVAAIGVSPLFVRSVSASALRISTYASWLAVLGTVGVARLCRVPLTRAVFVATIPGGLAFTLAQILGISAFQETSLAIASLIISMTPLLVVIAAVPLFGEKLRGVQFAWAALALIGVTAVIVGTQGGGGNTLRGDLYAMGCLVAGATMLVLMKHRRMGGVGASAYSAGMFLVAAMVETPILLVSGDHGGISGQEWLWLFFFAVANCTGIGLMAWAQRHVAVTISSVLTLGATVITAAGAWVFFDQSLGVTQIIGGLVVLASLGGIVVSQLTVPRGTLPEPSMLPHAPHDG